MLCCGYTLTDFPISSRLTSLALWQSNDCPNACKATLTNMDKYFMWIHYEQLHNHNKAKHNKTVCIFLGIYCISHAMVPSKSRYNEHRWEISSQEPLLAVLLYGSSKLVGGKIGLYARYLTSELYQCIDIHYFAWSKIPQIVKWGALVWLSTNKSPAIEAQYEKQGGKYIFSLLDRAGLIL